MLRIFFSCFPSFFLLGSKAYFKASVLIIEKNESFAQAKNEKILHFLKLF